MNEPRAEEHAALDSAEVDALDPSRIDPDIDDLRATTARGTVANSAFQISLSGLGVIQRLVVAAFLTRTEFGLWGVLVAILVNLSWLKDLGIGDKYVQQTEPDQERAFQKAFTLELMASFVFFLLVCLALPLWALAYDQTEIILPGMLMTLSVLISAFKTPAWIPYRRLQYARVRRLIAIDPVVGFAVTIGLAIAGAGYWCFVGGLLAGSVSAAIVCTLTSPYPLRLRFDRGTVRAYASFSWPLVGAGLGRMFAVQALLLTANAVVGLAGIGAIALATGFAIFADRVDAIVGQTIYPAVCAVAERKTVLAEVFVKSNRIALMWALPFGIGLALFSGDLITFVLGEKWRPAEGLLAAFGLTCALGQVAFNWVIFLRAVNNTRPIFIGAVVNVVTTAAISIPLIIEFGLAGYAAGFAAATVIQIALRGHYMRQLFGSFSVLAQLGRAVAPMVPAAGLILIMRTLGPDDRTAAWAVGELVSYAALAVIFTWLFERTLIAELVGYFRRRVAVPSPPATVPNGSR